MRGGDQGEARWLQVPSGTWARRDAVPPGAGRGGERGGAQEVSGDCGLEHWGTWVCSELGWGLEA